MCVGEQACENPASGVFNQDTVWRRTPVISPGPLDWIAKPLNPKFLPHCKTPAAGPHSGQPAVKWQNAGVGSADNRVVHQYILFKLNFSRISQRNVSLRLKDWLLYFGPVCYACNSVG